MITCLTTRENAKRFASVIQTLQTCEAACTHCTTEFDKNGHAEAMARYIGVYTDRAEYCILTCRFLERNGKFAEPLLEDCIEICSQCAEECNHHDRGRYSACATTCHTRLDVYLKAAGVEAITAEPTVF